MFTAYFLVSTYRKDYKSFYFLKIGQGMVAFMPRIDIERVTFCKAETKLLRNPFTTATFNYCNSGNYICGVMVM